ncbi:TPA: hypothetical protein ACGS5G_004958 [Escherichia coli]
MVKALSIVFLTIHLFSGVALASSGIWYADWERAELVFKLENKDFGWNIEEIKQVNPKDAWNLDFHFPKITSAWIHMTEINILESQNNYLKADGFVTFEVSGFGVPKSYIDYNLTTGHVNGGIDLNLNPLPNATYSLTLDWKGSTLPSSSWGSGSTLAWRRKLAFIDTREPYTQPYIVTLDIKPFVELYQFGWEKEVIALEATPVGEERCFNSRFLNEVGGNVSVRKVSGDENIYLKTNSDVYNLSSIPATGLFKDKVNNYEMCVSSQFHGERQMSVLAEIVLN